MVHVAVNKYDFEKINILEYAFREGGGGHQKAYAEYAFINVDNCERPLTLYCSIPLASCMPLLSTDVPQQSGLYRSATVHGRVRRRVS